jgi:hypothetical protein
LAVIVKRSATPAVGVGETSDKSRLAAGPGVTVTSGSEAVFVRVSPAKLFASKAFVTHVYVVAEVGAVTVMSMLNDEPGGIGLPVSFQMDTVPPASSLVQPGSLGVAGVIGAQAPPTRICTEPSGSEAPDVLLMVTVNVSLSPTPTLVGVMPAV